MPEGTAGGTRRDAGRAERARRRLDAARGYLDLEMPGHALGELAALPDPARHRFDLCRLRGEALSRLGRFDEAAAAYTRAWVERPDCLPVLVGLADCYRRSGRLDRAAAALEEADRLHPHEPAVLFGLARVYALSGRADRSLYWLGRAARICPDVAESADGDTDFAAVRTLPRFRVLLEAVAERCDD